MSILMAVHSAHVPLFREVYLLPPKKISPIAEEDISYRRRRYILLPKKISPFERGFAWTEDRKRWGLKSYNKKGGPMFYPMLQAHWLGGRAKARLNENLKTCVLYVPRRDCGLTCVQGAPRRDCGLTCVQGAPRRDCGLTCVQDTPRRDCGLTCVQDTPRKDWGLTCVQGAG